jgi:PhnB protein
VGEGEDHFIDELIFTDGAGNGGEGRIGGHAGDEVGGVEMAEGLFACAAGEDGDVVDVGVVNHGVEGGFGVAGGEFVLRVFFPEACEVRVGHSPSLADWIGYSDAMSQAMVRAGIAPMLSVRRGKSALEFYVAAFGATELYLIESDDGHVVARLGVGGGEFWVADESPEHANFSPESLGGGTVRMVMTVEDPDAMFGRAVAAGAKVVQPMANQYGWRLGRVVDPFGHHWEIGKQLE